MRSVNDFCSGVRWERNSVCCHLSWSLQLASSEAVEEKAMCLIKY